MKPKRLSSHAKLKSKLADAQNQLRFVNEANVSASKRIRQLEEAVKQRVDTTMLQQRIELAHSLGQMIEATSKAVMFIVAKETI